MASKLNFSHKQGFQDQFKTYTNECSWFTYQKVLFESWFCYSIIKRFKGQGLLADTFLHSL